MARTFYRDYTEHCLRFYTRYPDPTFRDETSRYNWIACEKALKNFSNENREMLISIYRDRDTVSDNVYKNAKERGMEPELIWKLLRELEQKVAINRGLI